MIRFMIETVCIAHNIHTGAGQRNWQRLKSDVFSHTDRNCPYLMISTLSILAWHVYQWGDWGISSEWYFKTAVDTLKMVYLSGSLSHHVPWSWNALTLLFSTPPPPKPQSWDLWENGLAWMGKGLVGNNICWLQFGMLSLQWFLHSQKAFNEHHW